MEETLKKYTDIILKALAYCALNNDGKFSFTCTIAHREIMEAQREKSS